MLSHANMITSVLGTAASGALLPNGRYLHAAPMFHLANGVVWMGRNVLGGTHIIVPSFDATAVADAMHATASRRHCRFRR